MSSHVESARREAFATMLAALDRDRSAKLLRRAPQWQPADRSPRSLHVLLEAELDAREQEHQTHSVDRAGIPIGVSAAGRFWLRRRWLERAQRRREVLATAPDRWAQLALLGVVAARELCCDLGARAAGLAVGRSIERGSNTGFEPNAAARIRRWLDAPPPAALVPALAPAIRGSITQWAPRSPDEELLRHLGARCLATLWCRLDDADRRALRGVLDEHFARSSLLESVASVLPFSNEDDIVHTTIDRWFAESLTACGLRPLT